MALSRSARVVFDTLLPASAHPQLPLGVLDTRFDAFYDAFARETTPLIRNGLRLAIFTATWVAPLLIGTRPPLRRLSLDERERALEAMSSSSNGLLRQLVVLLKLVAALFYGADRRVREAIGYTRELTA